MKQVSATQTKILRTAEQLLWARGYEGASLNEIVATAGISKGGLFHYYPNKKAVTAEVLEHYFQSQLIEPLKAHLAPIEDGMPVKVALMNWLEETFGAYAQKDFKGGCMLGNFALEVSDQDEDMRAMIKQMFLEWENVLVSALRTAAKDDKLLMEPRQFARLLISMFQGITMTSKVYRDQIRTSRDFQALAEFIERMIRD